MILLPQLTKNWDYKVCAITLCPFLNRHNEGLLFILHTRQPYRYHHFSNTNSLINAAWRQYTTLLGCFLGGVLWVRAETCWPNRTQNLSFGLFSYADVLNTYSSQRSRWSFTLFWSTGKLNIIHSLREGGFLPGKEQRIFQTGLGHLTLKPIFLDSSVLCSKNGSAGWTASAVTQRKNREALLLCRPRRVPVLLGPLLGCQLTVATANIWSQHPARGENVEDVSLCLSY